MAQIYLIQQVGEPRVTFGISPDAEATFSKLQESFPGRLELIAVATCRNLRSARQVLQMLNTRYGAYRDGEWYALPGNELNALLFLFRAINAAASTVKASMFQQVTGHPSKQHSRTKLMTAVAWISENDPEMTLSCREIGERAGVSHGTAYSAVQFLLTIRGAE